MEIPQAIPTKINREEASPKMNPNPSMGQVYYGSDPITATNFSNPTNQMLVDRKNQLEAQTGRVEKNERGTKLDVEAEFRAMHAQ